MWVWFPAQEENILLLIKHFQDKILHIKKNKKHATYLVEILIVILLFIIYTVIVPSLQSWPYSMNHKIECFWTFHLQTLYALQP